MLNQFQVPATAKFYNNDAPGLPSRVSLEWDSIQANNTKDMKENSNNEKSTFSAVPWNCFECQGLITNLNTIDAFKVYK